MFNFYNQIYICVTHDYHIQLQNLKDKKRFPKQCPQTHLFKLPHAQTNPVSLKDSPPTSPPLLQIPLHLLVTKGKTWLDSCWFLEQKLTAPPLGLRLLSTNPVCFRRCKPQRYRGVRAETASPLRLCLLTAGGGFPQQPSLTLCRNSFSH